MANVEHPFITYLANVLPAIESGSLDLLPVYDGPPNEQMEKIMRSITSMASRVHATQYDAGHPIVDVQETSTVTVQPISSGALDTVTDIQHLKEQIRTIAHVASGIADGDFSRYVNTPVREELVPLKFSVNQIADKLTILSTETMRLALEVGTEGILGGQTTALSDFGGTWKEVGDTINLVASRVTELVRAATEVTRMLARGDLTGRVTVDNVRGEALYLKESINNMAEHLYSVIGEANRGLKETQEGILGDPPTNFGASGAWKTLLDNVNACRPLPASS